MALNGGAPEPDTARFLAGTQTTSPTYRLHVPSQQQHALRHDAPPALPVYESAPTRLRGRPSIATSTVNTATLWNHLDASPTGPVTP